MGEELIWKKRREGSLKMIRVRRWKTVRALAALCLACAGLGTAMGQQPDSATIIRHIDTAIQIRFESVLGFTDTEHYAVYRGKDETHPAAEMTVKTTYRKGIGKSYTIVSQSGSELVQKFGLKPLLDNEKSINEPDKVAQSWFTSANYEMHVKPGGTERTERAGLLSSGIDAQAEGSKYDRRNHVGGREGRLDRADSGSGFEEPVGLDRTYADDAPIHGY